MKPAKCLRAVLHVKVSDSSEPCFIVKGAYEKCLVYLEKCTKPPSGRIKICLTGMQTASRMDRPETPSVKLALENSERKTEWQQSSVI